MPGRFDLSTLSTVSRPIVRAIRRSPSTNQTTIMLRIVTDGHERVQPRRAEDAGLFATILDVSERRRTLRWRKGWDSNPRGSVNPLAVFKTAALNRSATLPI